MLGFYSGDILTRKLESLGFPRQEGESDWEYRRRVFPEIYLEKGFFTAVSVLMGCNVSELSDMDRVSLSYLPTELREMKQYGRQRLLYHLRNFAQGFLEDPLETRAREQRVLLESEPQPQGKPHGMLRGLRSFFCGS